jgi:hypothetical protein
MLLIAIAWLQHVSVDIQPPSLVPVMKYCSHDTLLCHHEINSSTKQHHDQQCDL